MYRDNQEERTRGIGSLLLLLLLIALSVIVWATIFREKSPVQPPDYAPVEIEENTEPIGNDDKEKMDVPEGGGAVSLIYSKEVGIRLSENKVTLLFANPSKSTQDMVIQLVIQDTVVVQSGRLLPGRRVTTLGLMKNAERSLSAGRYEGRLILSFYDPQSGEKAMLNTEIPVTVTVTE